MRSATKYYLCFPFPFCFLLNFYFNSPSMLLSDPHTTNLPFLTFALLVSFGSVQPNAAKQGTNHTSNDNGKAYPPSIYLFSLKGQQDIKVSDFMAIHTNVRQHQREPTHERLILKFQSYVFRLNDV